jgi:hypothetical protein
MQHDLADTVQILGKYKISALRITTKHSEPVEEAAFANPHLRQAQDACRAPIF